MNLFTSLVRPQPAPAQSPVMSALGVASAETGVSFDYLVETARRESSFRPTAQASTSSARGLFQFIEQTWLSVVKSDGARFGLATEAAAITAARGRMSVADPAMRRHILALRDNPDLSARFAGVLADKNRQALTAGLGRAPSDGELYIAHFLGADGARRLITLAETAPGASAAAAFPAAARANRSMFHGKNGAPLPASAVYDRLVKGYSATPERAVAASGPAAGPQAGDRPPAVTGRTGFFDLFSQSAPQAPLLAVHAARPLDLAFFRRRQG